MLIEAVGTFLLMLAVMAVAVDKRAAPGFAGLIIGLSVTASLTMISNLTGGSINPARTFGPYLALTLLGGNNLWAEFPIYVIGPIVGAVFAAFVCAFVHSRPIVNLLKNYVSALNSEREGQARECIIQTRTLTNTVPALLHCLFFYHSGQAKAHRIPLKRIEAWTKIMNLRIYSKSALLRR